MSKYVAHVATGFTDNDARVIGEELERLCGEVDTLSPDEVIEKAKSSSSPLHDYFMWDDDVAAEMYRKTQARHMLRSIHIVRQEDDEPARAFHPVTIKVNEHEERGYVTLNRVLSEEDLLEQVRHRAFQELSSWQRRYSQYEALRPLVDRVREAAKQGELMVV